jgi:hypothetical protein
LNGHTAACQLLISAEADVGTMDATSSWWSLGGAVYL